MNKRDLWLRLKRYHFEDLAPTSMWQQLQARFGEKDASTRAFAQKLSRKLGWSEPFALKAVHEYKKFVYLGIVSDFVVTPSQIIDQVWHQHILFSKGYRHFCQEVIRYDFDHYPELVPMEGQTDIFRAQYNDTLELYRSEFGIIPPADIWGTTKFGEVVLTNRHRSRKKQSIASSTDSSTYTAEGPLYQSFDPGADGSYSGFMGFDGGNGGGAGASGNWDDGDSGSDASGGDSGSCGSCSSGCGGGD